MDTYVGSTWHWCVVALRKTDEDESECNIQGEAVNELAEKPLVGRKECHYNCYRH